MSTALVGRAISAQAEYLKRLSSMGRASSYDELVPIPRIIQSRFLHAVRRCPASQSLALPFGGMIAYNDLRAWFWLAGSAAGVAGGLALSLQGERPHHPYRHRHWYCHPRLLSELVQRSRVSRMTQPPLDFDPGEQRQCRRRAAIGRLGLGSAHGGLTLPRF